MLTTHRGRSINSALAAPAAGAGRLVEPAVQLAVNDRVRDPNPVFPPHEVGRRQPLTRHAMADHHSGAVPDRPARHAQTHEQFAVLARQQDRADAAQVGRKTQAAGERLAPEGCVAAARQGPAAQQHVVLAEVDVHRRAGWPGSPPPARPPSGPACRPPTAAAPVRSKHSRADVSQPGETYTSSSRNAMKSPRSPRRPDCERSSVPYASHGRIEP